MWHESESYIEDYLCQQFKKRFPTGQCLKFASPGRPGAPDRLLIHEGRYLFVEIKNAQGAYALKQLHFHQDLEQAGAQVVRLEASFMVPHLLDDFAWLGRLESNQLTTESKSVT